MWDLNCDPRSRGDKVPSAGIKTAEHKEDFRFGRTENTNWFKVERLWARTERGLYLQITSCLKLSACIHVHKHVSHLHSYHAFLSLSLSFSLKNSRKQEESQVSKTEHTEKQL